jgi:hypothetical protein
LLKLEAKIERAKEFIGGLQKQYNNPIAMASFGKDSMVLLHLLKTLGLKLPVLFHKEPFEPKKYEFANRVIAKEGYVVYDYPPSFTQMAKTGSNVEIISRYQVGNSFIWLGTGIKKPEEGKPFLCGYEDVYKKPTGDFEFPWDLCYVGHKSVDKDPIRGNIPLLVDIKKNEGSPDYAFPLRDFTDADIWEYTETFGVDWNEKRYDKMNGYKEFKDITFNNDYYHCCVNCLDRDGPAAVWCPKLNCTIANIGGQVNYAPEDKPEYLGES